MQRSNNFCQRGTSNLSKGSELRDGLENAKKFTSRDWWGMGREMEGKAKEAYFPWSNGVRMCDRYSTLYISISETRK